MDDRDRIATEALKALLMGKYVFDSFGEAAAEAYLYASAMMAEGQRYRDEDTTTHSAKEEGRG